MQLHLGHDLDLSRSHDVIDVIKGLKSKYSSSEPITAISAIVNRQCGDEEFKYVLRFYMGGVHVT